MEEEFSTLVPLKRVISRIVYIIAIRSEINDEIEKKERVKRISRVFRPPKGHFSTTFSRGIPSSNYDDTVITLDRKFLANRSSRAREPAIFILRA